MKQPYAFLIAKGRKKYEFRTWKTKYRGNLLIHAGKSVDTKAIANFGIQNEHFDLGCIIAMVKLTDVIEVDDEFREILRQEDAIIYKHVIEDKSWCGYAFKLEDVCLIKPIYIKGKLGLWNYDGKVEDY